MTTAAHICKGNLFRLIFFLRFCTYTSQQAQIQTEKVSGRHRKTFMQSLQEEIADEIIVTFVAQRFHQFRDQATYFTTLYKQWTIKFPCAVVNKLYSPDCSSADNANRSQWRAVPDQIIRQCARESLLCCQNSPKDSWPTNRRWMWSWRNSAWKW